MSSRVELTLLGQTLTVRTAAEDDYVRSLARYLESRVATLREAGVQDPTKALLLAALDITDELFRAREDKDKTAGDVGARLGALAGAGASRRRHRGVHRRGGDRAGIGAATSGARLLEAPSHPARAG